MTSKELQDFINYLDLDGQDANQVAVETWLKLIGCGEYVDSFLSHGYDSLTIFPNLTEKDLEVAGVKREDRRRLLMHNSKLKTNHGTIMDSLMKELMALSEAQYQKEEKKEASLLNLANLAQQAKDKEKDNDSPALSYRSAGGGGGTGSRRVSITGLYKQAGDKAQSGAAGAAGAYLHGAKVYCRFAPKFSCSITSCVMQCLHCNKSYCGACLYGEGGKMKNIHSCSFCGKAPRSLPSFSHRPQMPSAAAAAGIGGTRSGVSSLEPPAPGQRSRRASWSEPSDSSRVSVEMQQKYRSMVSMDL